MQKKSSNIKTIFKRIIIIAATIAFITGLGIFLHSKPPFIDALTGASLRDNSESILEGDYIFVMNKGEAPFDNENIRQSLKHIIEEKNYDIIKKEKIDFTLYVSKSDAALTEYAKELSLKLKEKGISVKVVTYEKTMLRSRILAGRYKSFISTRGFIDAESVKNSEYIMINSKDMK